MWANNDPAVHKKRLAKIAARMQRETPSEWEKIRKVETLLERLERPELRERGRRGGERNFRGI